MPRFLGGFIDRRPLEVREVEDKFKRVVDEGVRDISELRHRDGADATQVLIAERMFYDLMQLRNDFALMDKLETGDYSAEQRNKIQAYIKTEKDTIKKDIEKLVSDCKMAIDFIKITIWYLKRIRKSSKAVLRRNIHPRLWGVGKVLDFKARLIIFLVKLKKDAESLEASVGKLD